MEPESHEFAELMSMIVELRERVAKLESREVPVRMSRPSPQEVFEYCRERKLTDDDGEWFWNKMVASGWRNNGKPVRSWKATIVTWDLSKIFPSQKTNGTASIFGLKAALEVKVKQAKNLQNTYYDDTPYGGWTNQEARTNFIALKKEIRTLEAKIGACV